MSLHYDDLPPVVAFGCTITDDIELIARQTVARYEAMVRKNDTRWDVIRADFFEILNEAMDGTHPAISVWSTDADTLRPYVAGELEKLICRFAEEVRPLTVGRLIEQLSQYDRDMRVLIDQPDGWYSELHWIVDGPDCAEDESPEYSLPTLHMAAEFDSRSL